MSEIGPPEPSHERPVASVIISTYNRCDALRETLRRLGSQTIAAEEYEVVVVDDGSADGTARMLDQTSLPYRLRFHRLPENRGVSAGRNFGVRHASGECLIFLSDDVLVPEDFIAAHVATLRAHPGTWVVGGFEQLPALASTPFGRYLDRLERSFEAVRKVRQIGPELWEISSPTARNLSLPRADLDQIGLFDERFRVTCEDQDLAHRAGELGVRFLYNDAIGAVHNDQAASLKRYCRFQQRGARDTVLLCAKYPALHGDAPLAHVNGYVRWDDGARLIVKKLLKLILGRSPLTWLAERAIALGEATGAPDVLLHRAYRAMVGVYTLRGWREGLRGTPSCRQLG